MVRGWGETISNSLIPLILIFLLKLRHIIYSTGEYIAFIWFLIIKPFLLPKIPLAALAGQLGRGGRSEPTDVLLHVCVSTRSTAVSAGWVPGADRRCAGNMEQLYLWLDLRRGDSEQTGTSCFKIKHPAAVETLKIHSWTSRKTEITSWNFSSHDQFYSILTSGVKTPETLWRNHFPHRPTLTSFYITPGQKFKREHGFLFSLKRSHGRKNKNNEEWGKNRGGLVCQCEEWHCVKGILTVFEMQ